MSNGLNEKRQAMKPEELKELRLSLGLTQVELSSAMGLFPGTIPGWEGGLKATIDKSRKIFILLAAKAYKDGNLSTEGKLTQKFLDSLGVDSNPAEINKNQPTEKFQCDQCDHKWKATRDHFKNSQHELCPECKSDIINELGKG